MNAPADTRQGLLATLRREVTKLEGAQPPTDDRPLSTGCQALDSLLPARGLRRGMLVEYLTSASGSGAGALALCAAREACCEGQALIVLDRTLARSVNADEVALHFYPPAAAAWGIDLSRLLVLRPASEADALWAFDQALRCPGVGAVWAAWDRLDVRDFRRLQLAAECGRTLGLLVRPSRCRRQPTWADVRWLVGAESRVEGRRSKVAGLSTFDFRLSTWRLRVELVRCRGGMSGQCVYLELDESAGIWREVEEHATHSVPISPELADSAPARRA